MEEWTTALADKVVANSRFTASVVARALPRVVKRQGRDVNGEVQQRQLDVLYPAVQVEAYEMQAVDESEASVRRLLSRG